MERMWTRYKRSTSLLDEQQIRDQLLDCCSDELAEDMGNLFGYQLEMKDQTQLSEEMKRLAVVSQKSAIFHSIP